MNFSVCFIIPSVGRTTLRDTLISIQKQTYSDWKAIVVMDGIQNKLTEFKNDRRIQFIEAPKTNSAGFTRNFAMNYTRHEWIAFVDDDDQLREDYIERLQEEIQQFPEVKTVIWRIRHHKDLVPRAKTSIFKLGEVGIAFAIHKSIFFQYGITFVQEYAEDFIFLDTIRRRGLQMVLSPYVVYSVRNVGFDPTPFQYLETNENRSRINEGVLIQPLLV